MNDCTEEKENPRINHQLKGTGEDLPGDSARIVADRDRKVQALKKAISHERLQGYLSHGAKDENILAHYVWNMALCESLYSSLQCIEVALRNSLYDTIAAKKGRNWMVSEPGWLGQNEISSIIGAKERLKVRGVKSFTNSDLVAEMHFGFWAALFDVRYERNQILWPMLLGNVFPKMPKHLRKRNVVSARFSTIRFLRNSVFHHKPIWHWKDLHEQHEQIVEVTQWLSPEMAEMLGEVDSFDAVYNRGVDKG